MHLSYTSTAAYKKIIRHSLLIYWNGKAEDTESELQVTPFRVRLAIQAYSKGKIENIPSLFLCLYSAFRFVNVYYNTKQCTCKYIKLILKLLRCVSVFLHQPQGAYKLCQLIIIIIIIIIRNS
jgi:hypothetical protein